MKVDAKVSAAIDILDIILNGMPLNKTITNWFRQHRFAGSTDRADIQDIVYSGLRQKLSAFLVFKEKSLPTDGRALVLFTLYNNGRDLSVLFSGTGYGPEKITSQEWSALEQSLGTLSVAPMSVRLDVPEFLMSELKASLGLVTEEYLSAIKFRAPMYIRINKIKTNIKKVQVSLSSESIMTQKHSLFEDALKVTSNMRKISNSRAYKDGEIEIQDLSSQRATNFCMPSQGSTILDFCAGGGGKTLALASFMHGFGKYYVHDSNVKRMGDFKIRLKRAGFQAQLFAKKKLQENKFFADLVLVDAPCTGSGVWSRYPNSKWLLNPMTLDNFCSNQRIILSAASKFVDFGGTLAYMTCSLLNCENHNQIEKFLFLNKNFYLEKESAFGLDGDGDGFYVAVMKRKDN